MNRELELELVITRVQRQAHWHACSYGCASCVDGASRAMHNYPWVVMHGRMTLLTTLYAHRDNQAMARPMEHNE